MIKEKVKCNYCKKEIERIPTKTGLHFCDNNCKGKWQRLQREKQGYTKEWLIEEYINKGRSANDIAREIHKDPKRVWEWIKDYKIPTRPRGHNTDQLIKDGSLWKGKKHKKETKEKIRQARLKDGHVPYLVNGQHWLKAYNAHPATYKGGITPERQGFYSSEEWKECIKAVWKRDNATCQRCGKWQDDDRENKFHIHHIISFQNKETRASIDNLVLLCPNCHHWVHSNKNKKREFIKEIDNDKN